MGTYMTLLVSCNLLAIIVLLGLEWSTGQMVKTRMLVVGTPTEKGNSAHDPVYVAKMTGVPRHPCLRQFVTASQAWADDESAKMVAADGHVTPEAVLGTSTRFFDDEITKIAHTQQTNHP
ncbi:hypothetical protein C8J56DRAFT_886819 [Mycena floridula]|nr:hypothetical protein C8J56DRAFT_886819 [Mycena floridula]